MEGLDSI